MIGNATLVGYDGEDRIGRAAASSPTPPIDLDLGGIMLTTDDPFDPNNIGEDADDPTGPIAQLGDKVTWTYKVTNTGNVPLTITSLFDDNETPPLPPGTGDDDFEPAPVLKDNGFNFGDDNDNGPARSGRNVVLPGDGNRHGDRPAQEHGQGDCAEDDWRHDGDGRRYEPLHRQPAGHREAGARGGADVRR